MDEKHPELKKFVLRMRDKYGPANILVADHWDGDLCAIGLTDKTSQYTVYIRVFDKPKGIFFVSLENPPENADSIYSPAGEHDNLTEDEVEKMIVHHLKIG